MLAGAPNARDVGGLPVAGGGRIARGVLLRAEALDRLTDDDVAWLAARDLGTVFDLRTSEERSRHPNRPLGIGGLQTCTAPDDHAALGAVQTQIGQALTTTPEAMRTFMRDLYRAFPEAFGATIVRATIDLADGGRPVLVHCAAGKDRTGFVVAVLLSAAGVTRADVERDYLASNVGYPPERVAVAIESHFGHRPASDDLLRSLGVLPEYLGAAFDVIAERWGSVDGYLAAHGAGPHHLAGLRTRLLR